jgi:octaprenyl-diphosphate synthase
LATTEEHYLSVVRAKTAALFSAAAESGALLADLSDTYVSALRVYGDNLGIAFQLVDDALDYSGRQALMGKSVGDDFREGKATLPVILAYARADELARRFWQRTIETGPQSESDLDVAITLVEETGAISETMARARAYADIACKALEAVAPCETRDVLAGIADFCVERAY